MILRCNYEEVAALEYGGRTLLAESEESEFWVVAPAPTRAAVQEFLGQLDGDVSIPTLQDQRRMERAVGAIVQVLRQEMERTVIATHPADEPAVAGYFDFAHALTVLSRLRQMGQEMRAIIEVMTGAPPTPEVERELVFPD